MDALDFSLVLLVVAAAAAFLVWQLGLRRRKPACHPTTSGDADSGGGDVVLGASLARGLDAAERRKKSLGERPQQID